ncbi:anti-sigma factor [Streptomyces sp. DT24]|uniref:anti-sigma factor n=1 Tax=unclassified Streptomyces TaxID=2593676 RepID=UPI0023B937AC|nr:anti-sigma factor [Streptomyces sp. AM 4-1-1]WEH32613.1 anti-sigma factor [Streptomyces sp. AM 4-1-1]
MSSAEPHTLTGAYALHALPDDERRAFERHLEGCETCAQEVRELSATATRLGLAVAETPPRELRERVLRRITTVRQEPPAHTRRARTGFRAPSGAHTGGSAGRRWSRYALAACLASAVGLGGVAAWQHQVAGDARQEARQARQQTEQLTRVLAAPDARTGSHTMADGAKGTVVVSRSENRAVFLASGLRRPPSGKVYQLWFDDGGTMRPAGLLHADGRTGVTLMDGPVDRASGMGITVEPAGGSTRPTSAPLAVMSLPS